MRGGKTVGGNDENVGIALKQLVEMEKMLKLHQNKAACPPLKKKWRIVTWFHDYNKTGSCAYFTESIKS